MCGFFGRICFGEAIFSTRLHCKRQTSSENMSNHRRRLHRAAVRRPVRQPSRLQLFFKSLTRCPQLNAEDGIQLNMACTLQLVSWQVIWTKWQGCFSQSPDRHSCFQPKYKITSGIGTRSHGQDKTDMHELSKLWNKQRQVSMCWRHPGLLAAELVGLPQDPAGLTATLNKDTFVCLSVCMFVCLY